MMKRLRFHPFNPLLFLALTAASAHAQISLTSAADLAVRNSAKVKTAQAEVDKARAAVEEAKDAFIPSVNAGAALGQSYGYSTNPPTLFTITSQSLVFNSSQFDYIRSARAGYTAATLGLTDAREAVTRDTALAYIAVGYDQQRETVLHQQFDFATRLITIEQERLTAGLGTQIDLTTARLTAANFKLSRLHAEDVTAEDREHLARLLGVPPATLTVSNTFPAMPPGDLALALGAAPMSPAVEAAFANARAKQEQAFGDNRFLYRPQVLLFLQYQRYATFANSFKQLESIYGSTIGANEEAFGVQISIPFLDKERQAKARGSSAEAARAFHDAENDQFLSIDSHAKLGHSLAELKAKAEVADLDQQLAQQQLDAISAQLNASSSSSTGPQLAPKDEWNQRIAVGEKQLALLDAQYQLRQAQINLMRESGQLDLWMRQSALGTP